VFDHSWYGRVLVERVEGYATRIEWQRAYQEINDFEQMLVEDGTRIIKIFLHITPDEQIRRFRARLVDPLKRWKLSYEDFRNHYRWKDYEAAIEDALEMSSAKHAHWHLVPANNKPYGRLAAFRIIADRLSKGAVLEPAALDPKVADAAERMLGIRLPSGNSPAH
jgi:polyphosphate kinase 2 (PPK2 family)